MGFLRRLLGGTTRDGGGTSTGNSTSAGTDTARPAQVADLGAEERARELELARFEQDRTDDLVRRQQRFASYSWTPPAQGGPRRSDDEDATSADQP